MEKHPDCNICCELNYVDFENVFDSGSLKVCEFHGKLSMEVIDE